jgi:hypothetical protein
MPTPKEIRYFEGTTNVGSRSQLVAPEALRSRYKAAVDNFEVAVKSLPNPGTARITVTIGKPKDRALMKTESYKVSISSNGVVIEAGDYLGALHGLTFVESLIKGNAGRVRNQIVTDWPDHKIRALHLVIRGLRPEEIKEQITLARLERFNYLILLLKDNVRLRGTEKFASADAWTEAELVDVVRFSRENGLEVVPQLHLLTHQERFLGNAFPNVMYNQRTSDPRKEETYRIILPIIDEVIRLVKPRAFHIGHDEVAWFSSRKVKQPGQKGCRMRLGAGEAMLPPELFLSSVKRLHDHLRSRGVETWMWGDMLIAPEEFPTMLARHLHARGGYSRIRGSIPKDIVICDWHYFDSQPEFPSALAFAKAGHKVMGATWTQKTTIDNFSRYISGIGGEGMIATTWFPALKYKGLDKNSLYEIIKVSGEAFWNAKQQKGN